MVGFNRRFAPHIVRMKSLLDPLREAKSFMITANSGAMRLRGVGWKGFRKMNLWRQDKGQRACAAAFVNAVRNGGVSPIPFDELIEVGRVAIELGEAARR